MNDHVQLLKGEILSGRIISYFQAVHFASKANLNFGAGVDMNTVLRLFVNEGLIFFDPKGCYIYTAKPPFQIKTG